MSSVSQANIPLGRALLKAVQRKARREGQTAQEYVRLLIERDLLADRTFDEILGPVREDFRKSGIKEPQLEAIVERARTAAHRKQRRARR